MSKNPVIYTTAVHPEPITIASAIAVNNNRSAEGPSQSQSYSHVKKNNIENDKKNVAGVQVRTVPPRVTQKNDLPKDNADRLYGFTLKLFYVLSLVASILIFCNAHPKYELDEFGNKRVSSHFRPEVVQCCNQVSYLWDDDGYDSNGDQMDNDMDMSTNTTDRSRRRDTGLCSLLGRETSDSEDAGRMLEKTLKASPKFLGDEGIFDAFLDRPDIIVYLSAVIISFTLIWVYSLQKFAREIVIGTEALKVLALVYVAFQFLVHIPFSFFTLVSVLGVGSYGAYVYSRIDDIMKAAEVITHSAVILKNNTDMALNLLGLKVVYSLQTAILLITICTSYEIVEVRSHSASCYYESPAYLKYVNTFQIFVWIWTVWTFDMVRLFIVASITGTNYFHPNDVERRPSFSNELSRAVGKSFGTLALAGIVTSFLDILRKRNKRCYFWFGPQVFVLMVIELVLCICGACLLNMAYVFTKFSVILHSFTGKSLQDSGQHCHEIMRRRFVGGYITEITSQSVLWFASIVFSSLTSLIGWGWIDAAFQCSSFEYRYYYIFLIIIGLVVFHPVVGVILVICINISYQDTELGRYERGEETFQHFWIPPLAAAFIGAVTKLFFTYLGSMLLDSIDTMIVCFAIDEDNGVKERSKAGFAVIVKDMKEYIKAEPVVHYDIEADRVIAHEHEGGSNVNSATSTTSVMNQYTEQRR